MSELVVMNGAGNIARSVCSHLIAKNPNLYTSMKLVGARPFRNSVYDWQRSVPIPVKKHLARNIQSIKVGMTGSKSVVYFTHDYYTMSSDKNAHLVATAKMAKELGVEKLVAVCPIERDLAWSEDDTTFYQKTVEAEQEALSANPNMTILKTNLTFGPTTHLIRYLIQCSLVGKCPRKSLLSPNNKFLFQPVHISDVATAVSVAMQGGHSGRFNLHGSEQINLRQILDTIEKSSGKEPGSTKGPLMPPLDFVWDFLVGTTPDLNLARMVDFYEKNPQLQDDLSANSWTATTPLVKFSEDYGSKHFEEQDYTYPQFGAYRCAHTD